MAHHKHSQHKRQKIAGKRVYDRHVRRFNERMAETKAKREAREAREAQV